MIPRSVLVRSSDARQEQLKKMLGEDAAASGQAKGLDMALLAKQRARAQESSDADVDLDAALAEGQRAAQSKAEAVANAAARRDKFRKVASSPDVIYVNGKRMRRKVPPPSSAAEPATAEAHSGAARSPRRRHADVPDPGHGDGDDDDDIFNEVPVWDGLSDDEAAPAPQAPPPTTHGPRNWFAEGDLQHNSQSEAPSSSKPRRTDPGAGPDSGPDSGHDTDSDAGDAPPRLQGLSSSALPSEWSRWLLEREEKKAQHTDRAEEPARKRRRSRKGRGMEGGSP